MNATFIEHQFDCGVYMYSGGVGVINSVDLLCRVAVHYRHRLIHADEMVMQITGDPECRPSKI